MATHQDKLLQEMKVGMLNLVSLIEQFESSKHSCKCEFCQKNSETDPFVQELKRLEVSAQQRSPEWFEKRKTLVTASEMATVLCQNPYESRVTLLKKKIGITSNTSNMYTQHGNQTEDIACKKYEEITGHRVIPFGLWQSKEYPGIGGSPDGVTACGRLIEIKCPVSRTIIPGCVPEHYKAQLQTLMFVSGLKICDFVQYHTRDDVFDITTVEYDQDWYKRNEAKISQFHAMLRECHEDPGQIIKYERKRKSPTQKSKRDDEHQRKFDFIL